MSEEKYREKFLGRGIWLRQIESLPERLRAKAALAVLTYAVRGELVSGLDKRIETIMISVVDDIEVNQKWYDDRCKGGAPKGKVNNPYGRRGKPTTSKSTDNETDLNNQEITTVIKSEITPVISNTIYNNKSNINTSEIQGEIYISPTPLDYSIPPTAEMVETYCREQGLSVDAEDFVNYNESRGWKVNGSPIEDWRPLVRMRAKREQSRRAAPAEEESYEDMRWRKQQQMEDEVERIIAERHKNDNHE